MVSADAAIKRTLASAGPTQGVQEKLKVKPKIKAAAGDMAAPSSWNGRRSSLERTPDVPNTPS